MEHGAEGRAEPQNYLLKLYNCPKMFIQCTDGYGAYEGTLKMVKRQADGCPNLLDGWTRN